MSADDVAEKQGSADAGSGTTPTSSGPAGWRAKIVAKRDAIKSKPGLSHAYRAGVFIVGLLVIVLGGVLAILPGPWTIPLLLLGLYIWSTEFAWAHKLFERFKEKGQEAWAHAKKHPVSSGLVTVAGLAALGAVLWVVFHYDLIDRAKQAVGIGG